MVLTVGLMMVVSEVCRQELLGEHFQERELAKAGVCVCSPCASQAWSPKFTLPLVFLKLGLCPVSSHPSSKIRPAQQRQEYLRWLMKRDLFIKL